MHAISNLIQSRHGLFGLLVFFLLTVSVGQSVKADETDAVFDRGLLFKIEREHFPASYVLGTMHTGDPRVLALSGKVLTALGETERYVMEVVLDGGTVFSSLGNLWLLDGQKLQQVIGEELYSEVLEAGRQTGMPEATFTYMKPWVVMMMFSLPPGNYDNILDISLMKMALKQGKEITGLETAGEQFEIFDAMSLQDQKSLLQSTLKNLPDLTKQYERLLKAYLEKNLLKMQEIGEQQVAQSEKELVGRLMERLVDDRNRRMVKRLVPGLSEASNFVAVGALHLPGENGILNLLQKQGFTVSRVV